MVVVPSVMVSICVMVCGMKAYQEARRRRLCICHRCREVGGRGSIRWGRDRERVRCRQSRNRGGIGRALLLIRGRVPDGVGDGCDGRARHATGSDRRLRCKADRSAARDANACVTVVVCGRCGVDYCRLLGSGSGGHVAAVYVLQSPVARHCMPCRSRLPGLSSRAIE